MFWNISIINWVSGAMAVFKRFPFVAISSLVWTLCCILSIEEKFEVDSTGWVILLHIIMTSFIGVLAFLLTNILIHTYERIAKFNWLIHAFTLGMVLIYYFTLPEDIQEYTYKHIFIFISWTLILLLGISAAPFLQDRSNTRFWHYNKTIFFLFIESLFYSLALMAGISLGLLALNFLFGVDIKSSVYGDLLCLIFGIFFSFHFLSQFPSLPYKEEQSQNSRVYTIFSLYILTPLVLIYFAILYAFGIKLMFTEWPKGWVASLVLWFSITGVFAYIFNFPFSKNDSRFSQYFKKYFFFSLIPLSVLLFLSTMRRIHEYQLTEERILLWQLSIWLLGISLYFIFSKSKLLKVIPISLIIIGILSLYNPLNIFKISASSQFSRIMDLAEKNDLIKENKLLPIPDNVANVDKMGIAKSISYLASRRALDKIVPLMPDNFENQEQSANLQDSIFQYLGINEKELHLRNIEQGVLYFHAELPDKIELSGFEYLFSLSHFPITNKKDSIWVELNLEEEKIDIIIEGKVVDMFNISLIINDIYNNKIINYSTLDKDYFSLESEFFEGKLYLTNFNYLNDMPIKVAVFEGILLLKSKTRRK